MGEFSQGRCVVISPPSHSLTPAYPGSPANFVERELMKRTSEHLLFILRCSLLIWLFLSARYQNWHTPKGITSWKSVENPRDVSSRSPLLLIWHMMWQYHTVPGTYVAKIQKAIVPDYLMAFKGTCRTCTSTTVHKSSFQAWSNTCWILFQNDCMVLFFLPLSTGSRVACFARRWCERASKEVRTGIVWSVLQSCGNSCCSRYRYCRISQQILFWFPQSKSQNPHSIPIAGLLGRGDYLGPRSAYLLMVSLSRQVALLLQQSGRTPSWILFCSRTTDEWQTVNLGRARKS